MPTANQETAKEVIYRYVTGQEISMQVRSIVDAFGRMKEELDAERRAMERICGKGAAADRGDAAGGDWRGENQEVSKVGKVRKVRKGGDARVARTNLDSGSSPE